LLHHIDWATADERLCKTVSEITPTTSEGIGNMRTYDPYRQMEVTVIHGLHKSRNGTVIDSREKGGKEWTTVVMENTLERLPVAVEADHLLERL
jgi:hypothetical protein